MEDASENKIKKRKQDDMDPMPTEEKKIISNTERPQEDIDTERGFNEEELKTCLKECKNNEH